MLGGSVVVEWWLCTWGFSLVFVLIRRATTLLVTHSTSNAREIVVA